MSNDNNHFDRKPEYWESMTRKQRGVFSVAPLFSRIIIIAIVCAAYYYIVTKNYFPEYQTYIFWSTKIIIAFEILSAAARTLWGPILAVVVGAGLLYAMQTYSLPWITNADMWQLMGVGVVGFLVTIIVKL